MARYFRCTEPTRQCPHTRTREVQAEAEDACPIRHPDCALYRQSVPLLTALRERNPGLFLGGLGLLGLSLLALLLVAMLGDGGGLKTDLARLQTDLGALERRLDGLTERSGAPVPPPPGAQAWEDLYQAVRRFQHSVDATAGDDETATEPGLPNQLQVLEVDWDRLSRASDPRPEAADRQVRARQLVHDYEKLEAPAETAQAAASLADESTAEAYEDLIDRLRDGMEQARRLARPPPPPPPEVQRLRSEVRRALDSAREALNRRASKPRPPFPSADAGLAIATDASLAEPLVLPLLRTRFGGEWTSRAQDQRRFLATTDPAIAPGAIVTIVADRPYESLIDGSVDLVVTEQAADEDTRTRFAEAFGGAKLETRGFSEVIALDAVALLAHPDAPTVPVDMAQLGDGTWLVRGSDEARIGRLTGGAASLQTVPDPFQSLLSGTDNRALALYHQCRPNLRANYLPFRAAAGVRPLAPSPFSIGTEDYRLTYRITASHSPQSKPIASEFISFMTSDQAQEQIAASGFVDLRLRHRQETVDAVILTTLAEALHLDSISSASASRYSTNLRFGIDEHELDIKAQADLGRLPRALARDFPTGKVVILGFTDNTGSEEHNHRLSIRRAEFIAANLEKFGIGAAAAGLGQQLPVDTNDTDEGRARNRRAEVWVVQP